MRLLLIAILAGLFCAGAGAQNKIYKVRMPDGRILFTDSPPPGAAIVSENEAPAAPPPARSPVPAPAAAKQPAPPRAAQEPPVQAEEKPLDRSAQIDKAFAAVQSAELEVEAAKRQLEEGRAPKEGEMLGTARGGVRVGPDYQERLAKLEKAVAAAEQKLAKAREDLNAVR
jgi:predicted component of type VI protein secretion system